jgi:hypothetical protein
MVKSKPASRRIWARRGEEEARISFTRASLLEQEWFDGPQETRRSGCVVSSYLAQKRYHIFLYERTGYGRWRIVRIVRHPSWPGLATWSRLRDNERATSTPKASGIWVRLPKTPHQDKTSNGFSILRKLSEICAAGRIGHRGHGAGAVTGARRGRSSERVAAGFGQQILKFAAGPGA